MLMTIQFPIHPFWNFYCQNLGGKVSTSMQLNAPFLKMNFFLPKIVIIFKSKSSLKCESTMKWSVKSYSLWNAGLQFFTEQTCGQRCEGILKVLCSGEGGRVAHTLMRGSLLSSQPVTFLVETNPGLATLSHYTMSAILSRVWPSQGKPHRCWANDKHYEMYLSWNQVLMLSSGHTEVVSPPLILQYDQESICSIGDVDNAW